ncbi:flavin-containing monooxygenase [Aspergillus heteromorphus CBS 117.55]|uniref:Flavin-containing monooxygenase n=1 Tax=Aspergillus heteromorphus CBS 117.55 TaxID=1448321 RepID=A0A317VVK4_9EURO|nr:flavin-containing monooxygenase [Aspergillus heteromorphus CBS 117.55]PWY77017.1 flavin-containing monooxygenase [Aspergillus heteromorphus CBS 117.55]
MAMAFQSILPTLPCFLPASNLPDGIDAPAVARGFATLGAWSLDDFTSDAMWRDSVALTGTLRTFYSAATVSAGWTERCFARQVHAFQLNPDAARVVRPAPGLGWINIPFTFATNTPTTTCSGFVSLVRGEGGWKIWLLRTILEQFDGYPNVDEPPQQPPVPIDGAEYECVIVGCGQSGLSVAGRLQALGVSYVVVDKVSQVGESWLQRYESMKLHTPRETSHLPFGRTFTDEYPEFLSRQDLARGYQAWAEKYSINILFSTELVSGSWNGDRRRWTLHLRQNGEVRSIACTHVVMAVGAGGHEPVRPHYLGEDIFQGDILHTAQYNNPHQWRGKRAIIIGCANSAHDVAEDMVEAGLASVTMVQRSRTCVIPVEYMPTRAADTITTADRNQYSAPLALNWQLSRLHIRAQIEANPARFDALERAGFRVDRSGDVFAHVHERYGGHYLDVGNCANIVKGLIQIKSTSPNHPIRFTPSGLLFSEGSNDSHLPADVIVFATGFKQNVRDTVRQLFGEDVYDAVDDYWGIDNEGEIRGAFKPSYHGNIWFLSGTSGHSRYFSRFIALLIKAGVEGVEVPVYRGVPGKAHEVEEVGGRGRGRGHKN